MGNIYRVTLNLYSDSAFTTIEESYSTKIGITQCVTNLSISQTVVNSDTTPDFLVPYMNPPSQINFLGNIFGQASNGLVPTRFMPLASPYSLTGGDCWGEIVFSNGARIRSDTKLNGSGLSNYECNLIDKNGNVVDTVHGWPYFYNTPYNNYMYCRCIVCDSINNGKLDGALYLINFGAGYISGSWKNYIEAGSLGNEADKIKNFFNNFVPPDATDEPYQVAPSASGGGYGSATDTSEAIDFPSLPTLSAIGTGFVTLYTPTAAELSNLAAYMWNGNPQTLEFWRKIVADPIDLILGLNIVPFALPSAGGKNVTVGSISTDVYMTYTSTQYIEIDCGTLSIPEYYAAYLDYSPYTRFEIYLPYCGTHPLVADEVVGKTIAVKYHVDALSGSCVAFVKCGDSVLYEFAGNVCAQIPVTANQFGDMVRSAISIAASIGSMVASEGATAPMAVQSIASTATNSTALKPTVEKSGAIGGMSGQLGIQKPYIIITRPNVCLPANQKHYTGYPSFVTVELDDLEGYNEIAEIHLENVPATQAELNEIESVLKEGVVF